MVSIEDESVLSASHIINVYLWEKLRQFYPSYWGDLTSSPIIPAQEQPEVKDGSTPYIVYVQSHGPTGSLFGYKNETLSYRVYSSSAARISGIIRLAYELLDRKDLSADAVNRWLWNQETGTQRFSPDDPMGNMGKFGDDMKNFEFKTIAVIGATGAQPATEEGGRYDGDIEIEITYVQDVDYFAEYFGELSPGLKGQ